MMALEIEAFQVLASGARARRARRERSDGS
jgi:hypothetical protein